MAAVEFNEVDFTLDYSNKVPGLDVLGYSVGVIHYDFVNTPFPATSEAYLGLTASVPTSPGVRWFYDFQQFHGNYIQFSLSHTIEKFHEWQEGCYCGVQVGASLGLADSRYDEGYFGVDRTALNDLTLAAGIPFCFGKLTIRPSIGYSMMVDQHIRERDRQKRQLLGRCRPGVQFLTPNRRRSTAPGTGIDNRSPPQYCASGSRKIRQPAGWHVGWTLAMLLDLRWRNNPHGLKPILRAPSSGWRFSGPKGLGPMLPPRPCGPSP